MNQLVLTFLGLFFIPSNFNAPSALPISLIPSEIPFPMTVSPATLIVSTPSFDKDFLGNDVSFFTFSLEVWMVILPILIMGVGFFTFAESSCAKEEKENNVAMHANATCFMFIFFKILLCYCQLKICNLYKFYLV